MSPSQTTTVTAAAPAAPAGAATHPAAYTLFLPPTTSQAQLPAAAASTSTKMDHVEGPAHDEHLPMQFNAAKPVFTGKYAERQYVKERLALGYRVISSICHPEGASGHLTVRDPVDPGSFWVNPYGLHFNRMTVSRLLRVSHDGKILEGGSEGSIFNSAGFVIHSAIHAARPEVDAIVHAHCPYGKAFSMLGRDLPFYSQDSASFWDNIALYGHHGGIVLSAKESGAICGALGKKKALILQNHGNLTVGGSLESAVAWFMLLENECRSIINAESIGKPISLAREVAEMTYMETGTEEAGYFEGTPFVGTGSAIPKSPIPKLLQPANSSLTWSKKNVKDVINSRFQNDRPRKRAVTPRGSDDERPSRH